VCLVVSLAAFIAIPFFVLRLLTPPGSSPDNASSTLEYAAYSSQFLQSLSPIPPIGYEALYRLPQSFTDSLHTSLLNAPVDLKTGKKQIMFTIFNSAHQQLAKNLLCSSRAALIPSGFHIFIALDFDAYSEFESLTSSVYFLNLSEPRSHYERCCKLKLIILYQFLLWNVDTVICDDDIVFIRSPLDLFGAAAHLEVASESSEADFSSDFDYSQLNVGFFRVIPCELTVLLINHWIGVLIPDPHALDQNVLAAMINPLKIGGPSDGIQEYDLHSIISTTEHLIVRWFDLLAIVNGLIFHQTGDRTALTARERGFSKPYAIHLAFIKSDEKVPVFAEHGLWFVSNGVCRKHPKGLEMVSWSTTNPAAE
jgi:hypothetical protein